MNQERALENLPLDFFHLCLFLCEKEVSPKLAPAVWIIPKMSHTTDITWGVYLL